MDAYGILRRCGRLAADAAREVFTGLKSFGAALIGIPLPPEAFPTSPGPAHGPGTPAAGPAVAPARPPTTGPEEGAPPAGHPERLIPDVPPSPVERHLWSQLR